MLLSESIFMQDCAGTAGMLGETVSGVIHCKNALTNKAVHAGLCWRSWRAQEEGHWGHIMQSHTRP